MYVLVSRVLAALCLITIAFACDDMVGVAVGLPADGRDASTPTDSDSSSDSSSATENDTGTADSDDTEDSGSDDTSVASSDDTGAGTGSDTSSDAGADISPGTGEDTGSDTGNDTSSGMEADSGSDTDEDTSTSGIDSSTDTTEALKAVKIFWEDNGWILLYQNELKVQGDWNAYADKASTIYMQVVNKSVVCVDGNVEHTSDDYGTYYGAKVGFDLCGDPASTHTLGDCPLSANLNVKLKGITFTLAGTLPDELRVQFNEEDRQDGTYVVVKGEGTHTVFLSDATLAYDPAAPPLNLDAMVSILFYIHASEGPLTFDFCISNIRLLADIDR
jgi:hypothetical protein